ncbi:DUF3108 domain-containing protein [Pseudidiomarina tainanensis]|jgi:Protein of unknown function (DUF3108).|uniref:DUF3108 domain-containing protein n=1 Tax=Pseudidiomarina tainanensis TaxID=502365 RepID=A0ACD2HLK7_9GAMM|nr:DUF3108 domain-containing protein [Pseudidiomarina tainanensis]RZQ57142.1 DUF3108 domain-containing protein [Pseudidiomarina tainanensis]
MKRVQGLMAAIALTISAYAVAADGLTPYETRYEVIRGGSNYGEAVRTLTFNDGRYNLYTETEISLLFLSDRRRFWSEFSLNDAQVMSHEFTYKRSGTGRNKDFSGYFDYDQKVIVDNDSKQAMVIDPNVYHMDEAASIEQLRLDIQGKDSTYRYAVLDEKGQADELVFKRVGEEMLTLPYGEINAIKVERVRENSRRETDYWFAPELDYVLVKMAQREDGDEVATLQLKTFN